MSAIHIGDDLIHYEFLGRGRPVILLHSWVGSWRYWVPTMQNLQNKFKVYALDLHGFGDTSKNPQKYTIHSQAHLLHDFLDKLAVPKAAFIGHGLGAQVVTEFARLNPDMAPRMMLISPPLFDVEDLEKRPRPGRLVPLTQNRAHTDANSEATIMNSSSAMRAAMMERARTAHQETARVEASANTSASASRKAPLENPLADILANASPESLLLKCFKKSDPLYEKLAVDIPKTDARALKGCALDFDAGRLLDTIWRLPMPTVVLHGLEDALIEAPDEEVWRYIKTDKEDKLVDIPLEGVRHFPMLEYERFNRLVTDFLELPDLTHLKSEIKERWKRRSR
jgi:pimeloyl-ACP methyl ester carboxylesterase